MCAILPNHATRIAKTLDDDENGRVEDNTVEESIVVEPLRAEEVGKLELLDRKLQEDPINNAMYLQASKELFQLEDRLAIYKDILAAKSRTAKYWIQYLHYTDVLKMFIFAERSGNWAMHLSAVSKMIDLFAATGHGNYAKSARVHLQQMLELETTYPWVYLTTFRNMVITPYVEVTVFGQVHGRTW